MMKTYKKHVLVERKAVPEKTSSGIILQSNASDALVLKAKLIDKMYDQLDGIEIGDTVYVYKPKAFSVEGNPDLFFVDPEHVCGWEKAQ